MDQGGLGYEVTARRTNLLGDGDLELLLLGDFLGERLALRLFLRLLDDGTQPIRRREEGVCSDSTGRQTSSPYRVLTLRERLLML